MRIRRCSMVPLKYSLETISDIFTDENLVFASKSAGEPNSLLDLAFGGGFASDLLGEIRNDWINGDSSEGSGDFFSENDSELLIFNNANGDAQFGLPYVVTGRVSLPYPDTYGVDRKDDLAFVANGTGGVQVIDISNLTAPYHIGFIKPDGFARDVKIVGEYAFIAASNQGVVVG